MEAMRARANGGRVTPVVVVKLDSIHIESFSSWSDDAMRCSRLERFICIGCLSKNDSIIDRSHLISKLSSLRELDTSLNIVCTSEVMESYISDTFRDGSVSSILPTRQVIEVGSDRWVLVVWIVWFLCIIGNSFAWELSRNHIVEDSEPVSSTGVSVISPILSNSSILRADLSVCIWANGMNLQIIPIAVSI